MIALQHHIFRTGEWRRARLLGHPRVDITISADSHTGRRMASKSDICVNVRAIADSGAQSNLWSLKEYLNAGFSREDLLPVSLSLTAANASPVSIEGAFFALIKGRAPSGSMVSCRAMVYVSKMANGFFMSYDTMLDMGILSSIFPAVGSASCTETPPAAITPSVKCEPVEHGKNISTAASSTDAIRVSNCGCTATAQL